MKICLATCQAWAFVSSTEKRVGKRSSAWCVGLAHGLGRTGQPGAGMFRGVVAALALGWWGPPSASLSGSGRTPPVSASPYLLPSDSSLTVLVLLASSPSIVCKWDVKACGEQSGPSANPGPRTSSSGWPSEGPRPQRLGHLEKNSLERAMCGHSLSNVHLFLSYKICLSLHLCAVCIFGPL